MFLGSKVQPVRGADNLTTIYEPIVWRMWDPQHLRTLQASTACHGNSFTLLSHMYSVELFKKSANGTPTNTKGRYVVVCIVIVVELAA
jgi:hypothetical protein